MIEAGGNADDAALAAAIALTVVEPTGNGLGADAFAVLWDGSASHGLNASGRLPASWTPERFQGLDAMPRAGWDSVTVPGAVSAWAALSERVGALPFEALFAPALAAGERFASPDQARTLRAIAASRGEAFYRGDIAARIAAAAAENGAALTEADLAVHAPDWVETIAQEFDGAGLHEIPPNGQGIAALIALGVLSQTTVRDLDADDPRALHLQIEAVKIGLRDAEAFVSDAEHMRAVTPRHLLAPGYLARRAAEIDISRATDFGAGAPLDGGAVHLAAADASGMMVSFIQSNDNGFGAGVAVPGAGIPMRNRGAGFTLEPGHPNRVGPRKRPFHTIIPGFLMRGSEPAMAVGVMGGPMQAQGHVQMVLRTALWGRTFRWPWMRRAGASNAGSPSPARRRCRRRRAMRSAPWAMSSRPRPRTRRSALAARN